MPVTEIKVKNKTNITSGILSGGIFVLILLLAFPMSIQAQYANQSVLHSGEWHRIKILKEDIYKLSRERLTELFPEANPEDVRLYGANHGLLSYYIDDPKPDDLTILPLQFVKGEDGVFGEGDYVLFYAEGSDKWDFDSENQNYSFRNHLYSDTAIYFLTANGADYPEIDPVNSLTWPEARNVDAWDSYWVHEKEEVNLIHSGREWYEPLVPMEPLVFEPDLGSLIPGSQLEYSIRVAARSPVSGLFRLLQGEEVVESIQTNGVFMDRPTATYAQPRLREGQMLSAGSGANLSLIYYPNGAGNAIGWLDYLVLNGRSALIWQGKTLIFSDSESTGTAVSRFNIQNAEANLLIWEIGNPERVRLMATEEDNGTLTFKDSTHIHRKYILFNPMETEEPLIEKGKPENQNLHGLQEADMLIISHPIFRSHADQLAELHRQKDQMIVEVAEPQQIYNEFSGGIPDVSALRNFVKMLYDRSQGSTHPLKYLLLFGNGSFENKTPPPGNTSYILTYQSQNSTIPTQSFVTDDYFGLLDPGEGESTGKIDIGIGRLPVSDTAEAGIIIRKIQTYLSPQAAGAWRNTICFIGDDEDGNDHMMDAEQLSDYIQENHPAFNIDKIYLDAFPQQTTSRGESYPEATVNINNRVQSGALIVNYLGHGNELGLAHERVVKIDDITSWTNAPRYPLFITATCEFSRFDEVDISSANREIRDKVSAGELVLTEENGGGIALLTTTRLVYSAPNYLLNRRFYEYAFQSDEQGNIYRLGDLIRLSKNNADQGINKRNFTLLGDPAIRLASPSLYKVVTDSLNQVSVTEPLDTLKALSLVTISGHIEKADGEPAENFQGYVNSTVFDKTSTIQTLSNDGDPVLSFDLQRNTIYNGTASVENGRFRFTFKVPKDINYTFGKGKISYYAREESNRDGQGYFANIEVGGFTTPAQADTEGPEIRLFLNDSLFRNGDKTDVRPVLHARLSDPSGINTVGSGIGHDLIAILDSMQNESYILNEYYQAAKNDFTQGYIYFPLPVLSEGEHHISLKAWDNQNNSSLAELIFTVSGQTGFTLFDLQNYPNPFKEETAFTFGHNRPGSFIRAEVYIYSPAGALIQKLQNGYQAGGYRMKDIRWDGRRENGTLCGPGIYYYQVRAYTEKGETAVRSGKLVRLF